MRIIVTGSAGFIGFYVSKILLSQGHEVLGFDSFNDYYDVELKKARHEILKQNSNFIEKIARLEDDNIFINEARNFKPDIIIHLAAQAGVRYSLENPRAYIDANVIGTFNVMEAARENNVKHLLFSSTSSAYGANKKMPFAENDKADTPLTIYAATKRAGEAMLHAYSYAHKIPVTAFRFFTVYGPWGRPDMALFKFVKNIIEDKPIDVYNGGNMVRDFTYVEDLANIVCALIEKIPQTGIKICDNDSISPAAPWRLVNIGRGEPILLNDFIVQIENCLGKKAIRNELPIQTGDVSATSADTTLCNALVGATPSTSYKDGVKAFCDWYLEFYKVTP